VVKIAEALKQYRKMAKMTPSEREEKILAEYLKKFPPPKH